MKLNRIVFILLLLLFPTSLNAQEMPTPTPFMHPDGPDFPLSPEEQQAMEEEMRRESAAFEANRASRSVFDYPAAYLITEEAAGAETLFTPETIVRLTGAQVFHNWADFEAAAEKTAFDVVMLHKSAYDMVDQEWAYYAYRNNVIFLIFNIEVRDFGALVGDNCMKPNQRNTPSDWNMVYAPEFSLQLEDESYRDVVEKAFLEDCSKKRIDTNGTEVDGAYGLTAIPIFDPSWLENIPYVIIANTIRYGKPNLHLNQASTDGDNQ